MADYSLYSDNELEQLFQEIAERRKRIVQLLKERAAPLKSDYVLYDSENAPTRLSQLFGDKDDLIVIHNMGKGCVYCTLWADEINGVRLHLEDRAALVVVSPNTPEVQRAFAESRGWKFRMLSDRDMNFSFDMGFATERDGKRWAQPGFSTFHRTSDGTITRVGYDEFGPGDTYSSVWHFLELLKDGANEWEPQYQYEEKLEAKV